MQLFEPARLLFFEERGQLPGRDFMEVNDLHGPERRAHQKYIVHPSLIQVQPARGLPLAGAAAAT
jgi:hypothetical protein